MPKPIIRAYLDIETTGCSHRHHDLTVVGIAVEKQDTLEVIQLIDKDATNIVIMKILAGIDTLYTYNGKRFDLPFIKHRIGLDLESQFGHRDLMYDCWKQKLKGGLKAVEEKLGIARQSKGIDGWMAVRLWWDYINNDNVAALNTLLLYNKEDIVNLKLLRIKLGIV